MLFGVSAPLAKQLGGSLDPQLLAGLLSFGAFLVIAPVAVFRRGRAGESALGRADVRPLAGVVLLGGVLAPLLLMAGLQRTSGLSAVLLLNLEGPLTVVVGIVAFGEHLGRRAALSAGLIFGGAATLAVGGPVVGTAGVAGGLLVVGACAGWALDNNLTQLLTARDPFAVVGWKTAVAATVNLSMSVLRHVDRVPVGRGVALVVLGAGAYGASVVAAAYSLRLLGAAREAAVFAVAPLAGVVVSIVVLGERLTAVSVAAMVLMAVGIVALVGDRHRHRHHHDPTEHDHRHDHRPGRDEHHRHEHLPGHGAGPVHAHRHRHGAFDHTAEHVSDAHHRHHHDDGPAG